MRKGKVLFSPRLITEALQLPVGWEIEDITMNHRDRCIEMIISGEEFPEETGIEGAQIKRCLIVVHKEARHYEVKVLDG